MVWPAILMAAATVASAYLSKGSNTKVKQASTQSREQQQLSKLINEGLEKGEGPLGDLFGAFNEEEFNKGVRDPLLNNFKENILPVIQEKFIEGNQVGGSGMRRGLMKEGTDLQSKLAELLYSARQGHKQNQLAGLQLGLNVKPFENLVQPPVQSGTQGLVQGLSQGIGQGAGNYLNNYLSQPQTSNKTPAPAPTTPATVG